MRDLTSVDIGVQSVVDNYKEWAPILQHPTEESPELTALELCNFWWLLGVRGTRGRGVPVPADAPSYLLWRPLWQWPTVGDWVLKEGPFSYLEAFQRTRNTMATRFSVPGQSQMYVNVKDSQNSA